MQKILIGHVLQKSKIPFPPWVKIHILIQFQQYIQKWNLEFLAPLLQIIFLIRFQWVNSSFVDFSSYYPPSSRYLDKNLYRFLGSMLIILWNFDFNKYGADIIRSTKKLCAFFIHTRAITEIFFVTLVIRKNHFECDQIIYDRIPGIFSVDCQ